jgi:hypothetical protein
MQVTDEKGLLLALGKEAIMTKNTAWRILNPILLVLALNQLVTAIIVEIQGSSTPIISDETFEIFHEGTGYVFVGLIFLHLILNFNWIRSNYLKRPSK